MTLVESNACAGKTAPPNLCEVMQARYETGVRKARDQLAQSIHDALVEMLGANADTGKKDAVTKTVYDEEIATSVVRLFDGEMLLVKSEPYGTGFVIILSLP